MIYNLQEIIFSNCSNCSHFEADKSPKLELQLLLLLLLIYKALRSYLIVGYKNVMQGKLNAVAFTLRTYLNQFSLGGICKQK